MPQSSCTFHDLDGPTPSCDIIMQAMPSVLIRDLPEETHATLRRRAANEGKSLQRYLVAVLERHAERPTIDELMDRIDARSGGHVPYEQAVEDLVEDRERR